VPRTRFREAKQETGSLQSPAGSFLESSVDEQTLAATPQVGAVSSVRKACRILKALAAPEGARLAAIARDAGLDKATVLRLLEMLAVEGFVLRDEGSKTYTLGPQLQVIAEAATARLDLRAIAQPSLLRLAAEFEDTVMLYVPSGCDAVCLAVELGTFPLRANYIGVGERRILGVSAGSLALLAALPRLQFDAVMPVVCRSLGRYPRLSGSLIERMAAETRERGFALSIDVVIDRVGSIGTAVCDARGRPILSLSIAALTERIVARREAMAAALLREARTVQRLWLDAAGQTLRPGHPRDRDGVDEGSEDAHGAVIELCSNASGRHG
jgi:DNA-binding IclR family transcriptional regulator